MHLPRFIAWATLSVTTCLLPAVQAAGCPATGSNFTITALEHETGQYAVVDYSSGDIKFVNESSEADIFYVDNNKYLHWTGQNASNYALVYTEVGPGYRPPLYLEFYNPNEIGGQGIKCTPQLQSDGTCQLPCQATVTSKPSGKSVLLNTFYIGVGCGPGVRCVRLGEPVQKTAYPKALHLKLQIHPVT